MILGRWALEITTIFIKCRDNLIVKENKLPTQFLSEFFQAIKLKELKTRIMSIFIIISVDTILILNVDMHSTLRPKQCGSVIVSKPCICIYRERDRESIFNDNHITCRSLRCTLPCNRGWKASSCAGRTKSHSTSRL